MAKKVAKKDSTPAPSTDAAPSEGSVISSVLEKTNIPVVTAQLKNERAPFRLAFVIITLVAFVTRFFRIGNPAEVVFDEVHFGKFASHYLQREYYFDLHPPLAKLMFAFVGYLIGYDGKFKFDNIGDSYITNKVPYVYYRALSATLGSFTVSFCFLILETCGFSVLACVLGSSLVLFDSAQATQSRLILLDAALIFFMVGALLCYVRFRLQRHSAFGLHWWMWLSLTGFFLSCVISTKYVGTFTYMTVGSAVVADLWNLTDIRGKAPLPPSVASLGDAAAVANAASAASAVDSSPVKAPSSSSKATKSRSARSKSRAYALPLKVILKHFTARLYSLVIVPFVIYLFWFYVHFRVLSNTGPGANHMSPEFQATLNQNPVVKEALDVHFFDYVSVRSAGTDFYLHSHPERYPLQYDDGRISSQGQQVTAYHIREDPNSLWQILPPVEMTAEDELIGAPIVGPQQVMLRHVGTNTYLLTHDVASPGFPTNEEFTTVPRELAYGDRHKDTLFILDLNGSPQDVVRTKMTQFRLKHVSTNVVMWRSENTLPDWGFNQIEINGNKKIDAPGSVWYFDHIENVHKDVDFEIKRRTIATGSTLPRRSFFTDYLELQGRMFRSNNQLTATHPYMSSPLEWPLMKRGISFWSSKTEGDQKQIYLVGNHVGWYAINFAVVLFATLFVFDQLAQLREFEYITPYARQKLNNTLLWLFLGYLFHYFPFFLMGRQLFLHHYLPAQVMGSLLVGGLVDFFTGLCDSREDRFRSNLAVRVTVYIALTAVIIGFLYWSPLVYGLNLTGNGVRSRQWFNIDLQFSKADLPSE